MKKFLEQNKIFLLLYLLFLVIGGIILFTYEKGNEILYFNSLHTPFFDRFFFWITRLAEAPLFVLMLVIAIRFSYGKGIVLVINSTLALATTQLLKKFVFNDELRPSLYFAGKAHLNFVQGLEVLQYHSFPSGHTTGAFAFFFMLGILVSNKKWSILFFALALLVGISRVYLMEHFFRDVYVGSMIGVLTSTVFYLSFVRSGFYNNLSWKDKALLK